jgi:hypothetical protein
MENIIGADWKSREILGTDLSEHTAIVESHTTMKHHHHQFNFMMEIVRNCEL